MADLENQANELQALLNEVAQIKQDLVAYKQTAMADGVIDDNEQAEIDDMLEAIQRINTAIQQQQQQQTDTDTDGAKQTTSEPTGHENDEDGSTPSGCDPAEVQRIREQYERIIRHARGTGADVAADNLQHFIDGSGGTRQLDVSWLRGFGSIESAESRILGYVEGNRNLQQWAPAVAEGITVSESDYWDADIREYNPLSELAYASGASDMRGDVSMSLSRSNNIVTITGTVEVRWSDRYDWNAGQSFNIPGTGNISDDDGIYLKRCGGARDFDMAASWTFNYSGTYNASSDRWTRNEWTINGQSYTPSHGEIDTDSR